MIQIINWATVVRELTPTHLLVALLGYVIVHGAVKALKFGALLTKGMLLSDTQRAIAYIHARQKHQEKLGTCQVGDCIHVSTVSSSRPQSVQQA